MGCLARKGQVVAGAAVGAACLVLAVFFVSVATPTSPVVASGAGAGSSFAATPKKQVSSSSLRGQTLSGIGMLKKWAPPEGACTVRGVQICSHQARGIPGEPGPSEKPVRSVLDSIRILVLDYGVSCFDLDVFATSDRELILGHPRLLGPQLGLRHGRSPESLTLQEIRSRAKRRKAVPPTLFSDVLELIGKLESEGVPISHITFEPKGNIVRDQTLLDAFVQSILSANVKGAVPIIQDPNSATIYREKHPDIPIAAALYDRGFDSHTHRICDTHIPLSRGWNDLLPYEFFMPSATRLVGEESYCAGRIVRMQKSKPLHPPDPVHVSTWVIDDVALFEDTVKSGAVHSVISNTPLQLAPSCTGPRMPAPSPR